MQVFQWTSHYEVRGLLISVFGLAFFLGSLAILVFPDWLVVSLGVVIGGVCVFGGFLWTVSHKASPADRPTD
jgi:1,4-dihydroxy-2-naphthoate octaprenyltransferase